MLTYADVCWRMLAYADTYQVAMTLNIMAAAWGSLVDAVQVH
jgi:hypothetical protein